MKFYRCELCGNIIVKLVNGGGVLSCCGQEMTELKAGVVDAALEKHVPAFQREGATLLVQVGEIIHPMTPEHYIQCIVVQQGDHVQYVTLDSTDEPKATFQINPDEPATIYEYCNLHGLWKAEA
ncbi:MAG: desulfoferrodoxin family protein [Oscillospiraceae bacterium]